MQPIKLAEAYTLAHDISSRAAYQLLLSERRFADWIGRDLHAGDWASDTINRFLTAYAEGRSKVTLKGCRNNLVTLARWGFEAGLIAGMPSQVKRIKPPRTLPQAWNREQVQALLRASECFAGRTRKGVLRRALLRALWLTAYDTALRRGDLLALESDQVGSDGSLVLVQHKTGDVILCRLRPETVAAINATYPPARKRIFGDAIGPRQFYELVVACVRKAGLTGGLQRMRRTSATLLEQVAPGAAMRHLGHRTPGLAYKHYIDPKMMAENKPLPPPLDLTG